MTHTPGPWTRDLLVIRGATNNPVARVRKINVGPPGRAKYDLDITMANARLVVAAPDMLEAAKKVEEWAAGAENGVCRVCQPMGGEHLDWCPIWSLEDAIVKATGE